MKKVLVLGLSFVTLCSFMCTKADESAARVEQFNTTIDMTLFPERTIFTIASESVSQPVWRFDSDSLKLYHVNIPENDTYRVTWRLVNVVKDATCKAYIRYGNSEVNMSYEPNNSTTLPHWKVSGTYTFTKEKK